MNLYKVTYLDGGSALIERHPSGTFLTFQEAYDSLPLIGSENNSNE